MKPAPRIVGVETIPLAIPGERAFRISEGETRSPVSVVMRVRTEAEALEGRIRTKAVVNNAP